jgi:hypothetical protein
VPGFAELVLISMAIDTFLFIRILNPIEVKKI